MREVVYFKRDNKTAYECQYDGCGFILLVEDIHNGTAGPNALQDHAHTHRALSVRVINSSTPVEVEVVEV